jgi:glyoxylate/hydroxypyruvate reductase A
MAVLTILRDLPRMVKAQQAGIWDQFYPARTARTTRVGIMGIGRIGLTAASMLHGIGFPVAGWSRTRHGPKAMRCYAGTAELDAFLASTDILVGLLPDTSETRGLLNAVRLAALPRGAGLVNVGRGTLVVRSDLLAALDAGHLSFAILDVFETEPLPPADPVWRHPRVMVTAHLAGFASRQARAQSVARSIRQMSSGTLPDTLYDRSRGY